jgi:ArsR family transcriptional regulator
MDGTKVGAPTAVLKALGDETRFRILQLLLTHDLCVGALARRVGLSEAAVSQHLQVLRRAGLVRGEKRGYWTHYTVDSEALRGLARELEALADRGRSGASLCFRTALQLEEISQERRISEMCCTDCCQHPEKLKGRPEECTPEQIKECHGEVKEHPCESPEKD